MESIPQTQQLALGHNVLNRAPRRMILSYRISLIVLKILFTLSVFGILGISGLRLCWCNSRFAYRNDCPILLCNKKKKSYAFIQVI